MHGCYFQKLLRYMTGCGLKYNLRPESCNERTYTLLLWLKSILYRSAGWMDLVLVILEGMQRYFCKKFRSLSTNQNTLAVKCASPHNTVMFPWIPCCSIFRTNKVAVALCANSACASLRTCIFFLLRRIWADQPAMPIVDRANLPTTTRGKNTKRKTAAALSTPSRSTLWRYARGKTSQVYEAAR
jgi:hypothetical protein